MWRRVTAPRYEEGQKNTLGLVLEKSGGIRMIKSLTFSSILCIILTESRKFMQGVDKKGCKFTTKACTQIYYLPNF